MNNQFQYLLAGPITQDLLLKKGFVKSKPAVIGDSFTNCFFVVNHESDEEI